MKWRPISELTPELICEDLLFRIEHIGKGFRPLYVVGYVDENEDIFIHDDKVSFDFFDGGLLCNVHTLHYRNLKAIYFIDPKEIEL